MNPTSPPDFCCFLPATVTTTAPGQLLVIMDVEEVGLSCTAAGGCSLNFGAYLDLGPGSKTPIPNAARTKTLGASQTRAFDETLSGIIDVPAGTHKVGLGFTASGNLASYGGGDTQITLIALGGGSAASPLDEPSAKHSGVTSDPPRDSDRIPIIGEDG